MSNSLDKLVDLIVKKKLCEVENDVGFSSNLFMIFGLPTRKLKDNPAFWTKETSICKITIVRDPKYEIPYGCYARMNQIFIDSEVKTKNTNVIDLGETFSDYREKIGYKKGYANQALLRQLINYVTSTLKVEPKDPKKGRIMGVHTLIAKGWDVFFDTGNPEQLTLGRGKIVLDEGYAKYIHEHAVPLDMNMVRCFQNNSLALDFYRFLAYRNNGLNKPLSFPDHLLFEQLGTEIQPENERKTRERLKAILKAIQMYWPVQAFFEDGHFILKPSVPAVQRKFASKNPLILNIEKVIHKNGG